MPLSARVAFFHDNTWLNTRWHPLENHLYLFTAETQIARLVIMALRAVLPFGLVAIALLKWEQTQLHKPGDCHGEYNDNQKHRVEFGKHRTPHSESVELFRFSSSGLASFKTALQLVGADHQRR